MNSLNVPFFSHRAGYVNFAEHLQYHTPSPQPSPVKGEGGMDLFVSRQGRGNSESVRCSNGITFR